MRLSTITHMQATLVVLAAAEVQFSEYILASSSRTIRPVSVRQTGGDVQAADALVDLTSQSSATFNGPDSYVTLDFGKNIAGSVGFQIDSLEGDDEDIGITFTESSEWISAEYCDATQDEGVDLPLRFNLTGTGLYQADKAHQRGGFRYLTVVHNTTGTVSISNLTVHFTASPEMSDPAAYTGYFHSDDEKLNRVWYAGAYTNQLCSIDPSTGNSLGLPLEGWEYTYTIASKILHCQGIITKELLLIIAIRWHIGSCRRSQERQARLARRYRHLRPIYLCLDQQPRYDPERHRFTHGSPAV